MSRCLADADVLWVLKAKPVANSSDSYIILSLINPLSSSGDFCFCPPHSFIVMRLSALALLLTAGLALVHAEEVANEVRTVVCVLDSSRLLNLPWLACSDH